MNDYLSEKEQVEAIRNWWKENGKFIIAGIVLGAGGLIGWNQWQAYQIRQAESASVVYEKLVAAVDKGSEYDALAAAGTLSEQYASTPYALQSHLALAKFYMDQGKTTEAVEQLRILVAAGEDPLSLVARLRLARVLLYEDKPEEALSALDVAETGAFRPRFLELRGDAEFMLGRLDAARSAYTQAMADPGDPPLVDMRLLGMKLEDIGESEPVADASASGETTR